MRHYLIILFLPLTFIACAQGVSNQSDTLFNQTDKQGHKQGFWKVKYENGKLKYSAFFKDDKPLGLMKRYFEDGTIKAVMFFDISGITRTKIYYQDGPLAAEGNYLNSAKDSIWNYYSYYTKNISNSESYINGKKNGKSVCFFADGQLSEESEWIQGNRSGIWKQYFDNNTLKMSASFVDGKRNGEFILNYPNKLTEWKGYYKNDKRDGLWEHFDPAGNKDVSIKYRDGEPENAAELDAKEQELLNEIEKVKGKIPEPDETNFLPETKTGK
jgi:antitoxin component YwqK of YwqJK toxin-antitoxin module